MYPILADLSSILSFQRERKGGGEGYYESTAGWDWGWRIHPIHGSRKWHNGVDLPAPIGTPIMAPWDGVIERAWFDDLNGNAIRMSHAGLAGVSGTSYAHLDGFAPGIEDGVHVLAGDVIGYVGNTGGSTGPHLHFVVWGDDRKEVSGQRRKDVDPLPYLDSATKKKLIGAGISGGMLLSAFVIYLILQKY